MGREVRMVPPDWRHPLMSETPYSDGSPRFQPMYKQSYASALKEWEDEKAAWERGEFPPYADEEDQKLSFEEWHGSAPDPNYYMPDFPDGSCTHYQMYETCSEGTPISPVMDSPESLALWLSDNKASAFGYDTATYSQWLATIKRGSAPSAYIDSEGVHPGVALPE